MDFDLELSKSNDKSRDPDLGFGVLASTDSQTHEVRARPGMSRVRLILDYANRRLMQSFFTTRVTLGQSSGRMSSILDLPGSWITAWISQSMVSANREVHPERSREFYLELEAGRGRRIRIPDQVFERPEGRASRWTYRLALRDVEVEPGEFSRLLNALSK